MTHLAINPNVSKGGAVDWLQPVTDEEYGAHECLPAVLAKTKGILTKSAFDRLMTFASPINDKTV